MLKLLIEGTAAAAPRTHPPSKQGTNGFTETPADTSKELSLPTGNNREDGTDELVSVSDEALHRYRQAMYILTQKDRPIPTFVPLVHTTV
jgi:hypothetical protein